MTEGVFTGLCIGGALIAVMWRESWNWVTFTRYIIAAVLLIVGINIISGG